MNLLHSALSGACSVKTEIAGLLSAVEAEEARLRTTLRRVQNERVPGVALPYEVLASILIRRARGLVFRARSATISLILENGEILSMRRVTGGDKRLLQPLPAE